MPATRPEIDVLTVLPAMAPGLITQFPDGKPLSTTLPVANAQAGCVITPTIGAAGMAFTVAVTSNLAMLSQPLTVWLA